MFYRKGYTIANARANPLLCRLQDENPSVTIMANPAVFGNFIAFPDKGTIALPLKGRKRISIITLALHELWHIRCCHAAYPFNKIKDEKEAWAFARKYAKAHNYPFSEEVAKKALASYYRSFKNSRKYLRYVNKLEGLPVKKITEKQYKTFYEEVWSSWYYATRKELMKNM